MRSRVPGANLGVNPAECRRTGAHATVVTLCGQASNAPRGEGARTEDRDLPVSRSTLIRTAAKYSNEAAGPNPHDVLPRSILSAARGPLVDARPFASRGHAGLTHARSAAKGREDTKLLQQLATGVPSVNHADRASQRTSAICPKRSDRAPVTSNSGLTPT